MSIPDPFDDVQSEVAEPEIENNPDKVVVRSAAVGGGEGKIVSTYKEGAGYDASWTVVHAVGVDDWFEIHDHPRFKELLDRQRKVATYFRGGQNSAKPPATGSAPQQAQEAPGGEKRFCSHGEMVFKSGVSKAGNAYKLFSCTAPRGQQCPAQYLNK